MSKSAQKPRIRFKGFSDAWEQRKLDYYLEVSNIKNTDNAFTKEDVLSVSGDFGVVNQIEFQGRSFAGVSVSNYGIVQTGDVVYTKSPLKANPFGIIKTNKGKTGIVSVLYGVYHTKERANANFIQTYFEQDARLNNYLRPLVNKGAKNTLLISDTDALAGKVCFAPTLTEQCSVGQFFATLDNLITLHQCKSCKKVVAVQSAFARRNLSKWTDSWEQRKLGDIGTTFTGLSGKSKEDFGHGNARFVTYMNVFSNPIASIEQCEKIEIDSRQSQVKYGDVFFTTSSETPEEVGMTSIWLENQPNIYLNSFCFGYRPTIELDCYYLGFMLRSSSVRGNLILLAQGISRYNISKTKAMDIAIPVPNKDEQSKIGLFFKQLDNLITLHQCKVFYKKVILKNKKFGEFDIKNNSSWEQRKLGDYFIERNDRSGDGEMISVTINSGIRKFDELNRHDTKPDDLSKYKRVEIGDIAYNSMRMWQGASGYSPYSGILSPAYTVITPKDGVSSRFFAYLIKRPKTIHLFEINSQGLTKDTWNLKFPAFAPIEVKAPASYEEQVNISRILIQLDNLITLHQRIKIFITGDNYDQKNK